VIKARLAGGVPSLFYLWSPHALNAQYILNRIQLPAYSAERFELGLTDYPVDVLEKVGSKRLSRLTPDVAKLYSRFQMDNAAQESMLMQLDGHGLSAVQAVCAWVRNETNTAIWQAWIPNEEFTCSLGQIENKSECIECPAGSGSLGGRQTECELCAAGTRNQLASTFCLAKIISRFRVGPNHIGFFQPRAEQSACVSCDDLGDYYQEKAGQTACSACPVNTARSVRQDVTAANKSSCQCIPGAAPIDGRPSLNTVDRFSVNVQASSMRRARPERSALLF
jgi:hypothetical protein